MDEITKSMIGSCVAGMDWMAEKGQDRLAATPKEEPTASHLLQTRTMY